MKFKTKSELEGYVRGRIKQLLNRTGDAEYQGDPSSPMNLMLTNFPQLKEILIRLMSPQFDLFVQDIKWVSPKPTVFKILLVSGQHFTLSWSHSGFIAKVSGKRYDLLILREREKAIKAISNLIQYGPINANLTAEQLSNQLLVPYDGTDKDPLSNTEFR